MPVNRRHYYFVTHLTAAVFNAFSEMNQGGIITFVITRLRKIK
ncbi:hypothetical protein Ctu_1p00880 (plasmid) [Cronobacter turicensis z3032]|uniref:Uncharacterized protein n=1 Tax=Cronobacter turicensis (strain DSM 18703 / CCUG 55852 / LMG 23827 / z3032) TaxID=693216 RepID=C9Y5I0_CROTZ|nr:hypothetical protein Ctu_1p00880 [Cronobacter turicensis z3032]CCJ91417.1 hypothetical protein BN132_3345 [Cronobacter turicensis 564]